MNIVVYANRYERTEEEDRLGIVDNLAILGYPVTWAMKPGRDAKKVTLYVADGSKIWEERGQIWIDEGNGQGILRTFDQKPTITITGYYGNVNKSLRVLKVE